MKYVLGIFGGGLLGAVLSLAVPFLLAQWDRDPTVGGAYAAMAMLALIPVTALGAFLGFVVVSFWS